MGLELDGGNTLQREGAFSLSILIETGLNELCGAFVPAVIQFSDLSEDAEKDRRSSGQIIICFST